MPVSTKPYAGTKDYFPEEKRLQKYLLSILRQTLERFGYEEYSTSALEPLELYASQIKEELLDEEVYVLADREHRALALRTEMTPSVSRMVASKRDELAFPLRWYSIPIVWRYGGTGSTEAREFWQMNADIFGVENSLAEIEILQLVEAIFKAYGASHDMYRIRVNSQALLGAVFHDYLGIDGVQITTLTRLINHSPRLSPETFLAEIDAVFTPSQRENGANNKLFGLLKTTALERLPEMLRTHQATTQLQSLVKRLREVGIPNIQFDLSVMPRTNIYTGLMFEVEDTRSISGQPIMSGGRYDELVAQFGVAPTAAVGFSFDEAGFSQFLHTFGLIPELKPEADVYVVINTSAYAKAQQVIQEIRDMNVNVVVDMDPHTGQPKSEAALSKNIRYVLHISDKELESGHYQVHNVVTDATETHSLARLVSIIKDYRDFEED